MNNLNLIARNHSARLRRGTIHHSESAKCLEIPQQEAAVATTTNLVMPPLGKANTKSVPVQMREVLNQRRHQRIASVTSMPGNAHFLIEHMTSSSRRRSIFEMVSSPTLERCISVSLDEQRLDYQDPNDQNFELEEKWAATIHSEPTDTSGSDSSKIEALLTDGVPKQIRGHVWAWLLKRELRLTGRSEIVPKVSREQFAAYINPATESPWSHQIQLDVGRTFPGHSYFSGANSVGQISLSNVLKAYSLADPVVGYCQGIGFVAGIFLMHCDSDYDAFQLLLGLMFGFGYRSIYLPDMNGLHRCLYQLTRLLDTTLPTILEHLIINNAMPDLFATPWFLTLFSSQFPIPFVVRIFDLILYGNVEMIFRVIYLMLSENESILAGDGEQTFEDVMRFFKPTLQELSVQQLNLIFNKIFSLDFAIELDRFAVEFSVYREEQEAIEDAEVVAELHHSDRHGSLEPVSSHSSGMGTANGSEFSFDFNDPNTANDVISLSKKLNGASLKIAELASQVEMLQTAIYEKEKIIHLLEHENTLLRAGEL